MTRTIPLLTGLTFLTLTNLATAQSPLVPRPQIEERFDRATLESNPQFSFFVIPVIAEELKLTEEHVAKWKRIPDELLARHKEEIAKFDTEDRAVAETLAADLAAREKDAEKRLDDILTKYLTDDQKKRARQIVLQVEGLAAFRDAAVETALGLSDEQKRIAADRGGVSSVRGKTEDGKKAIEKMTNTFTAEQRAKWDELTGPAFVNKARTNVLVARQSYVSPTLQFWVNSNILVSSATSSFWVELGVANAKIAGLKQDLRLLQRTVLPAPRANRTRSIEQSQLLSRIQHESVDAFEALLSESQKTRLAQIHKQLNGHVAFNDLALLKAIAWTPEQNATVARVTAGIIASALVSNADPIQSPFGAPRYRDVVPPFVEFRTALLAVLTPAQRAVVETEFGTLLTQPQLEAITKANQFVENQLKYAPLGWSPAAAWELQGRMTLHNNQYTDARSAFREALRLNPREKDAVVGLVTLLAACPDATIRDGETALDLALKQADVDGRKSSNVLEALAMAYAETGRFDDAVASQKLALTRLKAEADATAAKLGLRMSDIETRNVETLETRLKGYEAKTPFRFKGSDLLMTPVLNPLPVKP